MKCLIIQNAARTAIATAAISLLLAMAVVGPAAAYTNVSVAEAHQMWQDDTFVLDVRTPAEFAAGHIPNAYNIPIADLASRVGEIIDKQDDDILVYCFSGSRSATASTALESTHEFTGVHNMDNGFSAWKSAGYETALIVVFADNTIENHIRDIINKPTGLIRSNELVGVGLDDITAIDSNITDISGVEYCTDLATIDLSRNSIISIAPIESLTNLTYLRLDRNDIIDISALEDLTGLVELRLNFNQISDVQPLEFLTSLTSLELYGNQIDDLNDLNNLTNLQLLSLGENLIDDVDPLKTLVALTSLNLAANPIENIAPLGSLTELTFLNIGTALVIDMGPVETLTKLTSLTMNANQIDSILPLTSLTTLTDIDLAGNQIRDLEPLTDLPNLRDINLTDNLISDISDLVANAGIGDGDILRLIGNPLNNDALCDDIPELESSVTALYYTGECDADADGDGLADEYEIYIGTQAAEADTDDDSLGDGDELIEYGTDPLNPDTDGDGINDGDEVIVYDTDPVDSDSDDDGLPDGWELSFEMNPNDPDGDDGSTGDLDGDGVINGDEYAGGTDPTDTDTDDDGIPDGEDAAPADVPPTIDPAIIELTAYEDVPNSIDLTPFETDDNDTGTDLTWSISGVDTTLFSATLDVATDVITITSEPNLSGSDTVTLTLADSYGQTDSEDVIITILPVNDPPLITNLPDIEFPEDTTHSSLDLDDYVDDVDNDKSELSWSTTQFGNLSVSIDHSTNIVTFSSKFQDWNGALDVPLSCTDPGGLSDSKLVTVTVLPVNDPPRFVTTVPDLTVDVDLGRTYNIGQHATDVDDVNSSLTWTVSDVNTSLFAAQTVAGSLIITPVSGAEGIDPIKLTVADDDGAQAEQYIIITITADSDGDGMPNEWERENGLALDSDDADDDNDNDGLTNIQEYGHNTNPRKADTDGDGYTDGEEVNRQTDPNDTGDSPAPWLAEVAIEPDKPEVWIAAPFTFSVTGEMRDGTPADLSTATITWELTDGIGAIDPATGTFVSDTAGQSTVTVTVLLDGETVVATRTFTIELWAVISVADAIISNSAESEISITLNTHGLQVAEIQFDLLTDPNVVRIIGIRAGESAALPRKTVNAAPTSENSYSIFIGGNTIPISDGTIVILTATAADTATEIDCADIICSEPICISPDEIIVPAAGGTGQWCLAIEWDPADVDRNNRVDAADIQRVINSALGLGGCEFCDIDNNTTVNAVDVQIAINAVLNIP